MCMIQILLATYNSERFLSEQLDSLLAQSCTDFEILIRDGMSEDRTEEIINRYIRSFPGKIRFLGKGKASACENFARLLEAARSELVMFCDHDDVWKKNKIEITLEAYKKARIQYGENTPIMVFTDSVITDENLNILSPSMMRSQHLNRTDFTLQKIIVQNMASGNTMLINHSLRSLALPVAKEALMHDHWITLAAAFAGRIIYVDEAAILYRQHTSNVIGFSRYGFSFLLKKLLQGIPALRERLYKNMDQAASFLQLHKDMLKEEDIRLLDALAGFRQMGYWEKRIFLWNNHFRKEGFLRNLGMFLFI